MDRSLKHLDLPNAREQATSKQLLDGAKKGDLDLVKEAVAELVKAGASLDVQDKVGGHGWWWSRRTSPLSRLALALPRCRGDCLLGAPHEPLLGAAGSGGMKRGWGGEQPSIRFHRSGWKSGTAAEAAAVRRRE